MSILTLITSTIGIMGNNSIREGDVDGKVVFNWIGSGEETLVGREGLGSSAVGGVGPD